MTTPDGSARPRQESPVPDAQCQERDFPDAGPGAEAGTGTGTGTGPATTPGLVVTEERLADGRHITYFGTSR